MNPHHDAPGAARLGQGPSPRPAARPVKRGAEESVSQAPCLHPLSSPPCAARAESARSGGPRTPENHGAPCPPLSPPCRPGLRGAIPYALSLHLDLEPMEKRQLIGTTTIIIVLFTILLLGGSTMPLIRLVDIEGAKARRRGRKDVNLSKTEKMVSAGRARREGGGSLCTARERGGKTRSEGAQARMAHAHSSCVHITFLHQGGGWTQGLKPGSLGWVVCQPRGNPGGGDV